MSIPSISSIAFTILAVIGFISVVVFLWRKFTRWASKKHVAQERLRSKMALKRVQRHAAKREKAIILTATTVANELVRTVITTLPELIVCLEERHDERLIRMYENWEAKQSCKTLDAESYVIRNRKADTVESPKDEVPKRGILSSIRRRLVQVIGND